MPRYALANHVFVCLSGRHVVILDLRQDRYLALDAAQATVLRTVVPGWPAAAASDPAGAASADGQTADAEAIAQLLTSKGLLEADGSGKDATPVVIERPTDQLLADDFDEPVPAGLLGITGFVAASSMAAIVRRWWALERVVQRVRQRNATRAGGEPLDVERARRLVAVFGRLQPFFFTSRDACLFETFALLEFLARYGIFPRWIFGVQAKPFAAHCWVQHSGLVFNDTVDHVSGYTPIMAV